MKKIIYIVCSLIYLLTLTSCDFEYEGVFTDDTTEAYLLYDYYVDEYGNEGIIARINKSKYIIAISADETTAAWGPMGETVFKADTIEYFTLKDNSFSIGMHQIMHSAGIKKFPAQAWCDAKNGKEAHPRAGSWHLPSWEEYKAIFGTSGRYVSDLNKALIGIGGTPLSTDELYWTCTEDHEGYMTINGEGDDYDPDNRVVILTPMMQSTNLKDRWLKKNNYKVRAIKYVYYKY